MGRTEMVLGENWYFCSVRKLFLMILVVVVEAESAGAERSGCAFYRPLKEDPQQLY